MKAIAIDDEPMALEVIKSHAEKVPFVELKAVFTDAFRALDYLQKEAVDIIFLDIKMPDVSGIDLYGSLSKKPLLIFTTAYSEHAATSFDIDAVDYLLKPFSFARFLKGCNKALELYHSRNMAQPPDHIFVRTGYEQVKLMLEDILYLEAAGNYVSFVLQGKTLLSRMTFSEAAQFLPGERFVRVHRSYIISVTHIEKLEKHQITAAGKKIPVSEGYIEGLREALKLSAKCLAPRD